VTTEVCRWPGSSANVNRDLAFSEFESVRAVQHSVGLLCHYYYDDDGY
jgi:hypothetical protein